MKFIKWFGITIGIVVLVLVIGLGYLGFIPGVSDLFGTNKPKDLGITYTSIDYENARSKVGTTLSVLASGTPASQSLIFSGSQVINTSFTQEEYTSLLNERLWEYYPLDKVQVRLNTDNTIELSATVLKGRLQGCIEALGGDQSTLDALADYLKYIPANPTIYAKGTVEIKDGRFINTNLANIKIGNLDLTGQIRDNLYSITNGAESVLNSIPGLTIQSFKIDNNRIYFAGTEPDCARSILNP